MVSVKISDQSKQYIYIYIYIYIYKIAFSLDCVITPLVQHSDNIPCFRDYGVMQILCEVGFRYTVSKGWCRANLIFKNGNQAGIEF